MASNFCAGCGTPLSVGAKFCPTCGRATAIAQQPAAPAFIPPPPVPPVIQEVEPAVVEPVILPPVPAEPVYTPPPIENTFIPAPQPPVQLAYPSNKLSSTIFGANLPAVSIKLNAGESIYTQSGGLAWMDYGISMTTNMQGGFMKGLGRMIAGESLFMATYTSNAPNQEIVISSTFPGSIAEVDVSNMAIIAQKSAFLCAQPSVTLSVYVTKSIGSGLFGGEGFILQRLSGSGKVFLEIDGSLVERTLAPGEKIKVDTGNVAAFEESVNYQAEMVKGFKNILFGGEGLFLTTLTGPGKVWLQTMAMPDFAKSIIPFLPKPSPN